MLAQLTGNPDHRAVIAARKADLILELLDPSGVPEQDTAITRIAPNQEAGSRAMARLITKPRLGVSAGTRAL